MPYVLQERRPDLDLVVEEMAALELMTNDIEGFLICIGAESGRDRRFILTDKFRSILEVMSVANIRPNGALNYILFKYGRYHIKPSYNNYKAYIGAIYKAMSKLEHVGGHDDFVDEYREAAAEIRRRILSPYEDNKIKINGDV